MKLEVGEFYLSAKKEIIEIVTCYEDEYRDSNDNTYNKSGAYYFDCSSSVMDLIAHIPKELHYKIIDITKDYYTVPMIRDSINNLYEKRSK